MMVIYVKYLILIFGCYAGAVAVMHYNTGAGIVSAGAFISYALIEIEDLKINNKEDNI